MRIEQGFQQAAPELPSTYDIDPSLQSLLRRLLPDDSIHSEVAGDLKRFSKTLREDVAPLARLCDLAPPSVTQYDHYGRRVDVLHTTEGWRALKGVAAKEGLVSYFYARERFGPSARIFGFAKTYLWGADSRCVGCPLSMTDGAARVIELHGTDDMKKNVVPRLLGRDPATAWTAGQWMTERPGGSDVSRSETVAKPLSGDVANAKTGDFFLLDGLKWFSSATDGDVALALARTDPDVKKGSRGLSLFLIKLRLSPEETKHRIDAIKAAHSATAGEREEEAAEASRNGIRIHRLKDKIGTKTLPTAELTLNATVGQLVGPLNAGVRSISSVLNITRLHSTFDSLYSLRRSLDTAIMFARVRKVAGGEELAENAMHTAVLARVEVLCRALLHLAFGVVALMGRSECGVATERDESLLRLLTPVTKAFAAGRSTAGIAECMEAMGGQGYMEETGVGLLMRDSVVERIWEGTQNVLALDVVRAVQRSRGKALQDFGSWATERLYSAKNVKSLAPTAEKIGSALQLLGNAFKSPAFSGSGSQLDPTTLRPFLNLLGALASSLFMLEQVVWEASTGGKGVVGFGDEAALKFWVESDDFRCAVDDVQRLLHDQSRETRMREQKELVYGRFKL